ncbi:MAG: leucine-rich repeat domain-containing protein [Longibaculum sp.]
MIKNIKNFIVQLQQQGFDMIFMQPLTEHDIQKYEDDYHIQIPLEYKEFLKQIGNGGVGPSSGIQSLENVFHYFINEEPIVTPSITKEDWDRINQNDYGKGLLLLVVDEHVLHGLYYQGEYKGQMVSIDMDHLECMPRFYSSFTKWYTYFLDEMHHGYDTQYFGTQLLGNEEEVLQYLDVDFDLTIYSLYKFKQLSQQTKERLYNDWQQVDIIKQLNLTSLFCYEDDSNQSFYLHQTFKHIKETYLYEYWLELIINYQKDYLQDYYDEIKVCLSSHQINIICQALSILAYHLDDYINDILKYLHHDQQTVRECVRDILKQDKKYKHYIYENIEKRDLRTRLEIPNARLRYYINDVFSRAPLTPVTIEDMQKIKVLDFTKYCPSKAFMGIDYKIIDDIEVLSYASHLTSLNATKYTTIHDFTPLMYCYGLKKLILSQTYLKDLSFLSNLKQIKVLDISDNQISDISILSELKQLTELHIYKNQIQDFQPLEPFKNLHIYVDKNQYSQIKNLKNATHWKIEIVNNDNLGFLEFLKPILDMPHIDNWLKQSVQQRNRYLLEYLSWQKMPIETKICDEKVLFYFYLNDSEFIKENPHLKASSDDSVLDESSFVIGKMGIDKPRILLKGKTSKTYYLVHELESGKRQILSSLDLTDLILREYEFYLSCKK